MAARYLVSGGDGNWGSTNNWSATSGGASGASFPTSADDVTFDINSGATNITINASVRACKTLTITADYTGTLTMTNALSVAGSITLGANMTIAGSGTLTMNSGGTLTSNGKTWPNALTLSSSGHILGDNWTVLGTATIGGATSFPTVTGNTMYCNGSVVFPQSNGQATTTTTIVMTGTGTVSFPSWTNGWQNLTMLEFNTSGTITLSGTLSIRGAIKYTAGTIVSTGSTLLLGAATTITCNASGMNFGTISITGGNHTFNGTHGFTAASWSQLVAGLTHTFTSGNTYSITSSFIVTATSASKCTFAASTGSSAFYLNYSGSTLALAYLNATDVDSSGGSAISVYNGTLTRTTNWTNLTQIGSGSGSGGIMRNPSLS